MGVHGEINNFSYPPSVPPGAGFSPASSISLPLISFRPAASSFTSASPSSFLPADVEKMLFLLQGDSMTPENYSRAVSELLDLPVLMVPLNLVKHAGFGPNFSSTQIEDRARFLEQLARATHGDRAFKTWDDESKRGWKWRITAECFEPTLDAMGIRGTAPQRLSPLGWRLSNSFYRKEAVIFTPGDDLSNKQLWHDIIGLYDLGSKDMPRAPLRWDHSLANLPTRNGIRLYLRLHEIMHVLQLQPEVSLCSRGGKPEAIPDGHRRLTEADADEGAFSIMRAIAAHPSTSPEIADDLLDTIHAVKDARALQSFLRYPPGYQIALAVADGNPALAFSDENELAVKELRLRAAAWADRFSIPKNSGSVRQLLQDWQTGKLEQRDAPLHKRINELFHRDFLCWSAYDPARTIPGVRTLLEADEIDNPDTKNLARLVLNAAKRFNSSLLDSPRQDSVGVFRPPMVNGSPAHKPIFSGSGLAYGGH
jgi:hypothetical protein